MQNDNNLNKEQIAIVVKETLVQLGIDASTPEAIISFQQDMSYIRTLRSNTDKVKTAGWITIWGMFIAIVFTALKYHQ